MFDEIQQGMTARFCLGKSLLLCLILIFLFACTTYGQQGIAHHSGVADSSNHGYGKIARLNEQYRKEKENGRPDQALIHLENAYQELGKMHDSLLRTNPSSGALEFPVRYDQDGERTLEHPTGAEHPRGS
jgi:hypothetical protein